MEQKVYISYSRTDKEKVYEIKEWLETHTAASFIMCQHDVEGLPEQYVMNALKGINDSGIFLFCWLRVLSTPRGLLWKVKIELP